MSSSRGVSVQPPKAEGPSTTGRHRAVPAPPAADAGRPRQRTPVRQLGAGVAAQPPTALRWGMFGAALVILIAVPLMSLSPGSKMTKTTASDSAVSAPTAADPTASGTAWNARLDPQTTASITSTAPTASTPSTVPGVPPRSSAAPAPTAAAAPAPTAAAAPGPVGPAAGAGAAAAASTSAAVGGGGTPGGESSGGSGSGTGGSAGSGAGQGGGGSSTSQAPTTGGQAGAPSSTRPAPTTQQPAPTSSTPAPPTKTCLLDLLGLCI